MKNEKSIAVLITCYNRVNTTLRCLEHLYNAQVPEGYYFEVYLVDDNSPDETGRLVKNNYPTANIIQGTGNLYWNGGMRLAWQTAAENKNYDFYLWLNDDTFIDAHAIKTIINDYNFLKNKNIESLIVSALRDPVTNKISYSGRGNGEKIIPTGFPSECDYVTGNFVLVPQFIYNNLGILNEHFSHGMGDNDYGYRAIRFGYKCHVTSNYVGYCSLGIRIKWDDPSLSFKERSKKLFSKTGGNLFEYLYFVKTHRGYLASFLSAIKNIVILFFPNSLKKFRK